VTITRVSNARFISIAPINGKANDNVRLIRFSVTVHLSNGTSEVREYTIEVKSNNNNPDGTYTFTGKHDLAGFKLTYDIKGNGSNIKGFKIG